MGATVVNDSDSCGDVDNDVDIGDGDGDGVVILACDRHCKLASNQIAAIVVAAT